MAYRLLEITAHRDEIEEARGLIDEDKILHIWSDRIDDNQGILRLLLEVKHTEPLIDKLAEQFETRDHFRLMLFNVEATLPRPAEKEKEEQEEGPEEEEAKAGDRISREELYTDLQEESKFSKVYVVMILLSVLVVCVGLINDNVAVIIGAMVIAPLLGPNVSLSLALTLGDLKLAWRSIKTAGGGFLIALLLSVVIGVTWTVDPETPEVASRTIVSMGDLLVALAAGSAGVLAFTRGVSAAVVGVMVAVALLPPLANFGLLLGSGFYTEAFGAFILVVVNIISINLAGIITFLAQGIRPRKWWEEKQAKKAVRISVMLWTFLLLIFASVIYFWF